jgi:hypothetical protein
VGQPETCSHQATTEVLTDRQQQQRAWGPRTRALQSSLLRLVAQALLTVVDNVMMNVEKHD